MQREHKLQKAIVENLRWNGIRVVETDVMSGLMFLDKRPSTRYSFINHHKAMGWSKGVPDLILALNNGETLWVELKDGNNNDTTDEQEYWLLKLREIGHNAVVWRSQKDADDFIKSYKIMVLKGELNGSAKDDNKRAFDLNERLASQEQADGRQGNN